MNNTTGKATAPIVFVTGIGQTWSSLKSDTDHRWNLFPGDTEVLFHDFPKGGKRRIAGFALQALRTALTGSDCVKEKHIDGVLKDLLRWCIVDNDGNLPAEVDVRIYGARSFEKLKNVDFATGEYTEDEGKSLLKRIYVDVPCKDLAAVYGAQNMYCFNYSTFSDLYTDADKLHEMIKAVIEDQKDKTGAKQVILIPMSMGATVVSAYLDKYYTDEGSVGENLVSKVISIVGAWDGSHGMADLLECNGGKDWNEKFYDSFLRETVDNESLFKCLNLMNRDAVNKLLVKLVNGLLDNLLLNTSAFMALIPKDRFDKLSPKLFSAERMAKVPRLGFVKAEAERYHAAQCNLQNRMKALHEKCGIGFYFLAGYNMPFGGIKSDFEFLGLLGSAKNANTDTVIQVESTVPGTRSVPFGQKLSANENSRLSPDGSVDAATAWFADTSWYFEGQEHELGTNNTALKLAVDIALGEVENTQNEKYPQFNESRDIRKAVKYLQEAKEELKEDDLSAEKREKLLAAMREVEQMLESTHNNRKADDELVEKLKVLVD
ncbi:MAG: hypothetical protein E7523_05955 [Ruminococcaceae bacterium]|nr:hypothetical protein [Oscillospiraceae bacterium]